MSDKVIPHLAKSPLLFPLLAQLLSLLFLGLAQLPILLSFSLLDQPRWRGRRKGESNFFLLPPSSFSSGRANPGTSSVNLAIAVERWRDGETKKSFFGVDKAKP